MDNQWSNTPQEDDENRNDKPAAPTAPAFTGFSPINEFGAPPPALKKHSGLGIASFIVFLVMAVVFVASLIAFIAQLADVIDFTSETVDSEEMASKIADMPMLSVTGFLMFGTIVGNVIGLILGIVGIVQKDRKKVFPILGTVLNGLVVGLLLLLFLIGIAVSTGAV